MSGKKKITPARGSTLEHAFAAGISGMGMLVAMAPIEALTGGSSVKTAWSNVGRYLDRAAEKQADVRREPATKE